MPRIRAPFYKRHPIPDEELLETASKELYDASQMKSLSHEEKAFLRNYKSSGFSDTNLMLRTGQYPLVSLDDLMDDLAKKMVSKKGCSRVKSKQPVRVQEHEYKQCIKDAYLDRANETITYVNGMDDIFAKLRRSAIPYCLYRGVGRYDGKHKVGDVVKFPEYLSTTLDTKVAWGYNYTNEHGALFVFRVKKGHVPWILLTYSMLAMDNNIQEYEVLFQRDSQWRVVRSYKTALHPYEATVLQLVAITPEEAVANTHKNPIQVYELESLPYNAPPAIAPIEHIPTMLTVMPYELAYYKAQDGA